MVETAGSFEDGPAAAASFLYLQEIMYFWYILSYSRAVWYWLFGHCKYRDNSVLVTDIP